jgi:hypothetical protein
MPRRSTHARRSSVFSHSRPARQPAATQPKAQPGANSGRKILTGDRFQKSARQRNRAGQRKAVVALTLLAILLLVMLERMFR